MDLFLYSLVFSWINSLLLISVDKREAAGDEREDGIAPLCNTMHLCWLNRIVCQTAIQRVLAAELFFQFPLHLAPHGRYHPVYFCKTSSTAPLRKSPTKPNKPTCLLNTASQEDSGGKAPLSLHSTSLLPAG